MRVLITGGSGMLAGALRVVFAHAGHTIHSPGKDQLDVTDVSAVQRAVAGADVVLHCAAYTRVDDAETDEAGATALNAEATLQVAAACRSHGVRLVYPGTDYVFDGSADRPYEPDDMPNPINAYGRSKLAGERAAAAADDYLILRTSWLYARGGRNFVRLVADSVQNGRSMRVVNDQTGSPTFAHDFAVACLSLLESNAASGIYHVANHGPATWYELARAVASQLGAENVITPCSSSEFRRLAVRPRYSVLDVSKAESYCGPMPSWRDGLARALASGDY